MAVLTLTVNDQAITATQGQTLLEAARDAGIVIPTLCHLEGVTDIGACRLCLVEVSGTHRLLPACVTAAVEGMVVQTETERLQEYRKMILEMLLAERNHICSVCVANGRCELQSLAAQRGVDHVRFAYQYPHVGMDLTHERFGLDHNRCILCTRCVRVCDQIEGAHTWDVAGRGHEARVITDLAQPWGESITCTSCGKCVMACPTGALFRQGATVAEIEHDRQKLDFLMTAREKKQWNV
jgi:bidirectional [NiFe] hydrogenase diaphorase subunit